MTVLLAQAVRLEGVSRSANCRWLQHYNHGVPNGTLSQDYVEGASRSQLPKNRRREHAKNRSTSPDSLTIPSSVAVPANKIKQRSIQLRAKIKTTVLPHIPHV